MSPKFRGERFNQHVANLLEGRCICDDGSCDYCQVYYASDENLALIIDSKMTEAHDIGFDNGYKDGFATGAII